MKKFISILILVLFLFTITGITIEAQAYTKGKTHVSSYKKKNGTRVKAHSKSVKYSGHRSSRSKKRR